jgi:hypothetical protein
MFKVVGIASLLATALGGWAIAETRSPCDARVSQLQASYEQKTGEFGYGEMMSGLRNAESYCDIGDERMAQNVLELLAQSCRNEGGCA